MNDHIVGPGEVMAITAGLIVATLALLWILDCALDLLRYALDRILPERDRRAR